MNFEDIVDMDWLNSHTTESLPSPPLLPIKKELVQDSEMLYFDNTTYQPLTTMPTTEQIKQLIDLAKRQLALRELQQQQQNITPEPESPQYIKVEEVIVEQQQVDVQTVSPESLLKSENRRDSFIAEEGPMSLEAYAESDGIDIKKLNSKERRQLRNKISARNFRVRRKEYITTLEGQVENHKKANDQLMNKLNTVEEENKQLKLQIDDLRRQNQQLSSTQCASASSETYRQDGILVEC